MATIKTGIIRLPVVLLAFLVSGCSGLLPRTESVVASPWNSFEEAQQTFDKITPYQTTVEDLKKLKLGIEANPNINILSYSDVLRRFVPGISVKGFDLDDGVQECLVAKSSCKGYEVDYRSIKRNRHGNFFVDFMNFNRKVEVIGWHFNGVLLVKNDVVVYKLTSGQPSIHEHEESNNPLGPFQGAGQTKLLRP